MEHTSYPLMLLLQSALTTGPGSHVHPSPALAVSMLPHHRHLGLGPGNLKGLRAHWQGPPQRDVPRRQPCF